MNTFDSRVLRPRGDCGRVGSPNIGTDEGYAGFTGCAGWACCIGCSFTLVA